MAQRELSVLLTLLLGLMRCALALAGDSGDLGGVKSRYTQPLAELTRTWPRAGLKTDVSENGTPVKLRLFSTPEFPLYMGAEQMMLIHVPLAQVESVLDDFAHYKDLFPGYDDIHVISREGSRVLTFWEQHVPLFFVPNVKYEMIYEIDKHSPDRKLYRYQLRKPGQLTASDGFVLIEKRGESSTFYVEYDFFDANWGPATIVGHEKLWSDSMEGLFLSDVALKLKAEHGDWSYDKIREESKNVLKRYPIESLIKANLREKSDFFAQPEFRELREGKSK